jgi:uncharacterized membrane protein
VKLHLSALLLVAALLPACDKAKQEPTAEAVFDESSINNVWHKAKLRGVTFRAIGQEPGWLLEITDGMEILLVTDSGGNRMSYPYVEPVIHKNEKRTEFMIDDSRTVIEIRSEPCRDSMSGEEFAVAVRIKQPDRTLTGCGRALY